MNTSSGSNRGSSGSNNCNQMMIEAVHTKTKRYPRGVEDCDASTDLKSGARRLRLKGRGDHHEDPFSWPIPGTSHLQAQLQVRA